MQARLPAGRVFPYPGALRASVVNIHAMQVDNVPVAATKYVVEDALVHKLLHKPGVGTRGRLRQGARRDPNGAKPGI